MSQFRATVSIVGIVVLSIFYHICATSPPPFEESDPVTCGSPGEEISCTIRAPHSCELGKAPRVSVELTNRTNHDILLVDRLDGSEELMRYPYCYFEIFDADGRSTILPANRCSFLNALERGDFVRLPPGGQFDPFRRFTHPTYFGSHLSAKSFPIPGVYRIRFHYSTADRNVGSWLGDWPLGAGARINEMADLLRRVPNVNFTTEISVRVVPRLN